MSERRVLLLDIKPKSSSSAALEGRPEKPLWTRSDNNFRFNFLPQDSPAVHKESVLSDTTEPSFSRVSISGRDSAFAFNFQIPADVPEEDMETAEPSDVASVGGSSLQDASPTILQEASSPPEPSVTSKTKKKKKSGKKKDSGRTEAQQEPSSAEGNQGGEDTELSAEEQLKRQLDWCIEQLELGMRSSKVTTKQKEEASRALKTLQSSKAPLVKKRQVMRAMAGDYRKKMENEKCNQFKLIQSEIASAKVKAISDSPKKSTFHRRAEVKSQTAAMQPTGGQDANLKAAAAQEDTSKFVFTASKEEFRFNFL